jgi:HD superfamily phosphohydrolase
MREFSNDSLSHDVIHGYIPFTSPAGLPEGEVAEQQIVDHPWVQRLRQIHQLQTAWWVYPTAEHTRFQHVLGAMHLASRAVAATYDSLKDVCPDVPSRGYVECLMRLAALLHDVGHGPFGHFFDTHYLSAYKLNHEIVGSHIIEHELGGLIRCVRRNPNSRLLESETLDPHQICTLIMRPGTARSGDAPQWLRFLRSLFCGLYTVDNMDFVLRDAYMSGYSMRAFDLDRLLSYSLFTNRGLTIHERGLAALERFISVRGDLFRTVYYHRTVRAIDLSLQELFVESKNDLFPGNPLEHLDEYLRLTEWSLLVRVAEWPQSADPRLRALGQRWQEFLSRRLRWKMACERIVFFNPGQAEEASVFSDAEALERRIRKHLPETLRDISFRVDIPRHVYRPEALAPSADQNFLYDPATGKIHRLNERELFRRIAMSFRICRIYAENGLHKAELAVAMDQITGGVGIDDVTNM